MEKTWRQLRLPVDDGMDDQIPPKGWRRPTSKVTEDHRARIDEQLRRPDPEPKD
jgi:hypothetical protein